MTFSNLMMTTCALAIMGTAAMADCADDLARLTDMPAEASAGDPDGDGREGIVQDGSLAPLQTAPVGDAAASDDAPESDMADGDTGGAKPEDGIAKDGTLAPLEGASDQDPTDIATSGQDAQAQQEGGNTAAASAEAAMDGTSAEAEAAMDGASPEAEAGNETDEGQTDREGLIATAEAALAAGDEAACQAAVDKIGS